MMPSLPTAAVARSLKETDLKLPHSAQAAAQLLCRNNNQTESAGSTRRGSLHAFFFYMNGAP